MPCDEVFPGEIYQHDKGGLHYQVDEVLLDLTGYEDNHEIGKRAVAYVQLEDGEMFSAGTPYVRTEEDFMRQFTAV
jgi:hypothetical protein